MQLKLASQGFQELAEVELGGNLLSIKASQLVPTWYPYTARTLAEARWFLRERKRWQPDGARSGVYGRLQITSQLYVQKPASTFAGMWSQVDVLEENLALPEGISIDRYCSPFWNYIPMLNAAYTTSNAKQKLFLVSTNFDFSWRCEAVRDV
ncbi:hypothetical protein M514_08637 [Trichuris suis]|uniref:Uncharacterized protein n=1 Tax=Trichuris suis TaxID=68888 RepID=A0A085N3J1_9BILA|nr:hypothetical protein M513_08637 [Trichuris suis]KFD64037.1 hypothetical protein M514_08637 [Trichuris suis]